MDAWRKVHRVLAALFLLCIPLGAYGSSISSDAAQPSPWTYAPLLPLAVLTVTGTWLLVRPWFRRRRTA